MAKAALRKKRCRPAVPDYQAYLMAGNEQVSAGRANRLAQFFAYLPNAHTEPGGRWATKDNPNLDPRAMRPIKPRSCANYFGWLRTFFLYLVKCGVLDKTPMRTLRPAKHRDDQPDQFSLEEAQRLINAAAQTAQPERDIAIIALLDTGTRVNEVSGLTYGNNYEGRYSEEQNKKTLMS